MMSSIGSSMASSWASKLFSQLDTKNQGYIEQSDLASALNKVASSSANVEELFNQLDGDSNGKVTQSEMSTSLAKRFGRLGQPIQQHAHGSIQYDAHARWRQHARDEGHASSPCT